MNYNLHNLLTEMHQDPSKCPIPLFHGTDEEILRLSEYERSQIQAACNCLIDYSFPVVFDAAFGKVLPANVPDHKLEVFRKLQTAYTKASGKLQGLNIYEYDSTYMTFNPLLADHYAKLSSVFGETGFTAYWLYQGAIEMGYPLPTPSDTERKAIDCVLKAAMRKPSPVILMFSNIPYERIRYENGTEVVWEKEFSKFLRNDHRGSVRISGHVNMTDGKRIDLSMLEKID